MKNVDVKSKEIIKVLEIFQHEHLKGEEFRVRPFD